MFSRKLKPIFVNNKYLIRLGPQRDGGYVIDKRIINKIDFIITCGLSDDWDFEKNFLKLNKKVKVLAFDHTVNSSFWKKRLIKDLIHFFLLKKLSIWKIINIFKYFDYLSFFRQKNQHLELKIGRKNIKDKEINIKNIINQKENILLKVDIEGGEYKILNDIKFYSKRINCLIIEFHDIKKNLKKIYNFIDNIKDLKSIHIHGNNINKLDKNGYPYAIEITFINVKRIKYEKKSNLKNYPISGLDFPSVKRNDDIKINFF